MVSHSNRRWFIRDAYVLRTTPIPIVLAFSFHTNLESRLFLSSHIYSSTFSILKKKKRSHDTLIRIKITKQTALWSSSLCISGNRNEMFSFNCKFEVFVCLIDFSSYHNFPFSFTWHSWLSVVSMFFFFNLLIAFDVDVSQQRTKHQKEKGI